MATKIKSKNLVIKLDDSCIICQENFNSDNIINKSLCPNNHFYHQSCLWGWILTCIKEHNHIKCPACNVVIMTLNDDND